jgi:Mg2+ and Co2+ transporter CorA
MIATQTPITDTSTNAWFDEFIATIRTHQLQLETNTANSELENLYKIIFSGNTSQMAKLAKDNANQHFIKAMVLEYLKEIHNAMPNKLAFDMNDNEVLVWAEINDDAEELENQLILAEAKVNAKYHQYGYDITSMITETSDYLSLPSHYVEYKNNNA